jgi:hypothetical protein
LLLQRRENIGNGAYRGHLLRPSPAVRVKIAIQKVSIFTLTTVYLKNTPTIIFISLFIFLKYYFLIFFFILYFFSLSLFPLSLSLSGHSSPVGSQEFHSQPTSGQNTLRSFLAGGFSRIPHPINFRPK